MGIFILAPAILGSQKRTLDLIIGPVSLPKLQAACVNTIAQDPADRHFSPFADNFFSWPAFIVRTNASLIFRRTQNLLFIQFVRDLLKTQPKQLGGSDALNHTGDILIHQQLFGAFLSPVAVNGKGTGRHSIALLVIIEAPHFNGYIPAVCVVKEIFNGDVQIVGLIVRFQAVVIIVDGNKPHVQERKYLLKVFP